jgi:hypothetical protein
MKFEKNQIVVALEQQSGCQGIIIHEGAIVRVANPDTDDWDNISVYKSLERETRKHPVKTMVKERILRSATHKESKAYYKGIRNISDL